MDFSTILAQKQAEYFKGSCPISGAGISKKCFVPIESLLTHIKNCFNEGLTKTVKNATLQATIQNVLYIDLDYHVKESLLETYLLKQKELINEALTIINNSVKTYVSSFSTMSFIPDSNESKQGLHVFVWCSDLVTQIDRNNIGRLIKEGFEGPCVKFMGYIDTKQSYEIPDMKPLGINTQIPLPFCEKADAKRRYILNDFDGHLDSLTIEYSNNSDKKYEKPVKFHEVDVFNILANNDSSEASIRGCSNAILQGYAYLMFLSDDHPLFNLEKEAKEYGLGYTSRHRLMYILLNVSYVCFLYDVLFNNATEKQWETMKNVCYTILKNILIRYHVKDTETKVAEVIHDQMSEVVKKLPDCEIQLKKWKESFKASNSMLKPEKVGHELNGYRFQEFLWHTQNISSNDSEESFNEDSCDDEYEKLINETQEQSIGASLKLVSIVKSHRDFFKWVLDNLTNEFVAFRPVEKSVIINGNLEKYLTRENDLRMKDDHNNRMFLAFAKVFLPLELYEQQNIENVISEFIKNWISWGVYIKTENEASGTKRTTYIYNQFQCYKLYEYPYNQWIIDKNDIFHDITIGQYSVLVGLLESTAAKHHIYPLMNCFGGALNNVIPIKRVVIKPLINFGKSGYSSIRDGVYCSAKTTLQKFDEYDPATSHVFPVRDGWIIWNMDGSFEYSRNNYNRFMPVYTNLIYDEDFAKHYEKEYEMTQKYIREIFPVTDERDYVMKCISTVLNGKIRKDTLIIQYGTGADGKSFFSNAIMAMLGEKAYRFNSSNCSTEIIKGQTVAINNVPNSESLGTSAKSTLLLATQGKANDTDEGGKVQLRGKRYCCLQEPDMKTSDGIINGSVVKDILSGAPVALRGLYEATQTVQLNALLFLQTNSHMKIDDTTDGTKRRVKYIRMKSKFYSETTKETFKNLEYHFKADPDLEQRIVSSNILKSALFNILMPYCQELLREHKLSISDIPIPTSYQRDSNEFFSEASRGFGAFAEQFLRNNVKRFLPFGLLLTKTVSINHYGINNTQSSLKNRFGKGCFTEFLGTRIADNDMRSREALIKIMSDFFVGKIYIATPEALESDEYINILKNESKETPQNGWTMDFDEFRDKFLDVNAKSEIKAYAKDKNDFEDVIIGGVYWDIYKEEDPETGGVTTKVTIPK